MSNEKSEQNFLGECPHCGKKIKIILYGDGKCELQISEEEPLYCDSCGIEIPYGSNEGGKCIQCGKVGCKDELCQIGWDPRNGLCNNCKYFFILGNWFEPDERLFNKEFEMKSSNGIILGKMIVERGKIMIFPSEKAKITENDFLFKSLFLESVIRQMQEEDLLAINKGKLKENKLISYEIIKSVDNNIQRIIINHFRTYDRMMKILNYVSYIFEGVMKITI